MGSKTERKINRAITEAQLREAVSQLHRLLGAARSNARSTTDAELHALLNGDPKLYAALTNLDAVCVQLADLAQEEV